MLGFLTIRRTGKEPEEKNEDVAKVFFDSFSKRVLASEDSMKGLQSEIAKLKLSVERSQISDLVLLERLHRNEQLVRESVNSIKETIENTIHMERSRIAAAALGVRSSMPAIAETRLGVETVVASKVVSPTGEVGSLPSITTPTELQVLTLLANEGPKSAPEIGRVVGRSREHTARLMKKLFEEGYIRRDQARIPFRYSLVEKIRQSFKGPEVKDGNREETLVPQT